MRQCMDESVASVYTFRLSIARAEDEAERKTLYFCVERITRKGRAWSSHRPKRKSECTSEPS